MPETTALHALAAALGVDTHYTDGLGNDVWVSDETLIRVCASLGAPVDRPEAAANALAQMHRGNDDLRLPPVLVAWDGELQLPARALAAGALLRLESGETIELRAGAGHHANVPLGYHTLTVGETGNQVTVIAAPVQAFRRAGVHRCWGISAQLAALRSQRSRAVGDLHDLEILGRWVRNEGGELVTVLPLLPTFNTPPVEPSPYSPVSRLFWSELILDLGPQHVATGPVSSLDVGVAHAEVWAALAGRDCPDALWHEPELVRYAEFRGAQARLGRNWRDWPATARSGVLHEEQVDPAVTRFHLIAQAFARTQLAELGHRFDALSLRLGLDLTVGVHPDGYDAWSRQQLFASGMSVGAPPDPGFPSGQDWGFGPMLPNAARADGHRYFAQSLAHQMSVAGSLRIDHIMSLARLYWIPHGMGLHEGTYVSYPAEEQLAVVTLESYRHQCEVVGENLGTVPDEINHALQRHRIWGMYLAQFQATGTEGATRPGADDVALIGSHDTPTFAGWLRGADIEDRVAHGLLDPAQLSATVEQREQAIVRLAALLDPTSTDASALLHALLRWLGRSQAAAVLPWIEDLWLEVQGVNLPGTPASVRPNWQRPMGRLLEDVMADDEVLACLRTLHEARTGPLQDS